MSHFGYFFLHNTDTEFMETTAFALFSGFRDEKLL